MPGTLPSDGLHHGLFRPPVSSASSSAYYSCVPANLDAITTKRKRNLGGGGETARRAGTDADDGPVNMCGSFASMVPRGRVYRLAGHLDTPGGSVDDGGSLGESMYSDSNYRRALGSKRPRQDVDMPDPSRPTPLFSLPDRPTQHRTWSTAAFTTIGGVVGKVWQLCRAGGFGGFHAGGGRGYEMDEGDADASWCVGDEWRLRGHFPRATHGSSMPVGNTDEDGQLEDEAADTRASTPTSPAAKRRQTAPTDDLNRNWVMVKEPHAADWRQSRPRPPTRNPHQGAAGGLTRRISTPGPRRQSSRLIAAAAPSLAAAQLPRPSSTASFAPARSPSPSKKASSNIIALAASAGMASPAAPGHSRRRSAHPSPAHPTLSHRRTHSNASTASSRAAGVDEELKASPRLNAEAKHLAARRKMEEHDADVRIEAFNRRLQDMIRQGKEALGTSIEIAGGDGGWEDEEE
ncbi:hypothetical protein OCS_03428 [Ophiocordyceps sinensis CO18]|uniref:Uncharacterized protein n=1 Tax=Ophiocordyceps sinensis (strain Co18 / CGMCC 3.14243) TaxID=911162 RepID=T5AEK3_OPHSC|nr:hypothetical protein OCS_03428 [Ophiocordyceps sinensis CO18]